MFFNHPLRSRLRGSYRGDIRSGTRETSIKKEQLPLIEEAECAGFIKLKRLPEFAAEVFVGNEPDRGIFFYVGLRYITRCYPDPDFLALPEVV